MACSAYGTNMQDLVVALQDRAFIDAVACLYTNSAGTLVVGMFTFGAVSVALYFRTGGVTMPTILTLLIGGIVLPFMPGAATQIAGVILLFAIGIGPVLFLRRLSVG